MKTLFYYKQSRREKINFINNKDKLLGDDLKKEIKKEIKYKLLQHVSQSMHSMF